MSAGEVHRSAVRRRRSPIVGACVTGVAALLCAGALSAPAQAASGDAPLRPGHGEVIGGRYIVVLADGVNAAKVAGRNGVRPRFTYGSAVTGFSAGLSRTQLDKVRKDPAVRYVEPDGVVTRQGKPAPPADPAANRFRAMSVAGPGDVRTSRTQTNATWGIDRIDQRTGLNTTYDYTGTGGGVTAYIIDSGIRTTHSQFGTRAFAGFDAFGGNGQDCNGHGSHVAGTVGGAKFGVAKGVRLVGVRVLDCNGSGTLSGVIAGIDWVTHNRQGPSVANMSLGGGYSSALNEAVARSTARGVTHVVAAGNENANACSYSPASAPSAITVAATGRSSGRDVRAGFSNHGSCVDVFAPGVNITSAWSTSDTAYTTISGTSMASPHVAGLAALFLQSSPYATPATVEDFLESDAARGVVSDPVGSPNLFARKLTAALSATGASSYQPDGTSWYQAGTGYITGLLTGTAGTDPDLYLERWNGSSWATVARSASLTSRERIVFNGAGGYHYRWRVHAFDGGGTFDLWANHPQ